MIKLKYILLVVTLFFLYKELPGQVKDTLIKSSVDFKVGKLNSKGKRTGWWLTFSSKGYLEKKEYYKSRKRFPKIIIKYEYSDSNKLQAYGKLIGRTYKHGKWRILNDKGKLIRIERYRYNDLHGVTKDIGSGEKIKYYRGRTKEQLYNSKGKRYVYFFAVGMPSFREWDCVEEEFACIHYSVAGCVVPQDINRRTTKHNFFVSIRQSLRYGFGWKKKYFKGC